MFHLLPSPEGETYSDRAGNGTILRRHVPAVLVRAGHSSSSPRAYVERL